MRLAQFAFVGMGVLVVLVVTQAPAWAGLPTTVPAPEIDGTSVSTGLGLLAAGVMIARSRMKSK